MTLQSGPQGWGRENGRYLRSDGVMLIGIYFWFRLFYVVPETTARFLRLSHQSRSQSPPWVVVEPPILPPLPSRERPLRLPPSVPLSGGRPLVVGLSPAGKAEADLGPTVTEVERERDDGQALLGDAVAELDDLALVEQEPAASLRVVGPESGG